MKTRQARSSAINDQRSRLKALLCFNLATAALAATTLGQPILQFSLSAYDVSESAGVVTLTVQRSGDLTNAVTVNFATVDGTATAGLDYCAINGTLAFAVGEIKKPIVVPILNDGVAEASKSFRVTLSNPTTGAVLGTRTSAVVSVMDNDLGVNFTLSTYSVTEDGGAVGIGVVRGNDGTLPMTVDLTTSDVTASNGVDYTAINCTLSFAGTERFKLVSIPILNDSLKETSKTFRASLRNPVGTMLGNTKTATVTIQDNDPGLQFELTAGIVTEDAGVARINVLRGNDETNSTVTVDYATSDLTATHGLDYVATNGTLSFAPGETVKLLSVLILNDGSKEGTETFRLTLSNPTGGGLLGSRATTTFSILDNDPRVGFELLSCTNAWGQAGDFAVTVLRGNDGALGAITVDYATSDLTAIHGVDYTSVSGTLTFQENETVKTLNIPLLRPRAVGGARNFRVTLSNPTGGAVLGTATSTVRIVGTDATVAPPFDAALAIRTERGGHILTWAGGGTLRRADRVTGPWQTLTAAKSPWTVQSPIPAAFYQVTRPRPANLYVPSSYDGHTPVPLVILLHGGHWTGEEIESYMQLRPQAEARGFLYCYPTGTLDLLGLPFWNAYFEDPADAAAFAMTAVDDVGFLRDLIEEVASHFCLDRKRVYLIGHSNGGFMAYWTASQCADLVAGIASLAGTSFLDWRNCRPSELVNILQIHGTADSSALYWGGAATLPTLWCNTPPFAGAVQQVRTWADYNGASEPVTHPSPLLDLTSDVAGLDTMVTRYTNCRPGGAVELWTINNGSHAPTLSPDFSLRVIDWLLAHPKP